MNETASGRRNKDPAKDQDACRWHHLLPIAAVGDAGTSRLGAVINCRKIRLFAIAINPKITRSHTIPGASRVITCDPGA
jgi:hypothetical protein